MVNRYPCCLEAFQALLASRRRISNVDARDSIVHKLSKRERDGASRFPGMGCRLSSPLCKGPIRLPFLPEMDG